MPENIPIGSIGENVSACDCTFNKNFGQAGDITHVQPFPSTIMTQTILDYTSLESSSK